MKTSKVGNYSVAKDNINSLFRKFEFERIEESSCTDDTTAGEPKAQSEEVACERSKKDKRYEYVSLRPQTRNPNADEKAKLDTLHLAIEYHYIL
jgi:hypothetical protein